MGKETLFWGEIHTHTELSDGNGTVEENFEIAESHLDFWAMADHAYDREVFDLDYRERSPQGKILNDHWEKVQAACRERERPGRFIPFLAYEWTNFRYGHHNVYYLDYDQPLRMPPTLPGLYRAFEGVEAFVIPHHTGYPVGICGKDWDYHDERLTPFVEIYSTHGSSEEPGGLESLLTWGSWMGPGSAGGSVQEALARGYRLGIMASSDSHLEHPGAYDNGLVAACAEDLTRAALWKAFRGRRIYGVTGDRIELAFSMSGAPMGSVVPAKSPRKLEVDVTAWDRIDRVDIIRNGRRLTSFVEPAGKPAPAGGQSRVKFHLEWGWDRLKDFEWAGSLHVPGGRILQAVPCYRGNAHNRAGRGIRSLDGARCTWTSKQAKIGVGSYCRSFADGIAFEVEGPESAPLRLDLAYGPFRQSLSLPLREITKRSIVRYMEPIPQTNNGAYWSGMETYAKFKVHRGAPAGELKVHLSWEDAAGEASGGLADYYYVRVIQRNGQRAWSSPIWVEKRTS